MKLENLEKCLQEFLDGTREISIHENYKDDFDKFLKLNNVEHHWIDRKRKYLNYRTTTLNRAEFRNSEIRKLRKINKEKEIEIINHKKDALEKELIKLKEEK